MRSRALPTKARVGAALLVSVILILAVASSPIHSALAGTKEPAPPKPAKPKGSASTFNFNQYGPSPYDDVVLRWGEQTLTAVRATKPGPAVVARSLAVVHTAMYDAWAAYDAKALGTRTGASLRRPSSEFTANYKSKAISYAAYRVLLDLFPSRASDFSGFMTALGYDPGDTSTDPTLPQGIGNRVAQAVLGFRHADGANQLGDYNGGVPYSDYTGYKPLNDWNKVSDVYHWQPLCVPTPRGDQLLGDGAAVRHPPVGQGDPVRAHQARPVRTGHPGPLQTPGRGQGPGRDPSWPG
jgi:hypothetical protein